MRAEQTTVSNLKRMAADPHEHVIFRQTRNWDVFRWNCVQRLHQDGTWKKITNTAKLTEKKGWAYAIWRLRIHMILKTDNMNRQMWSGKMYKIRHGVYMTYYLVCRKRVYSIQGTY